METATDLLARATKTHEVVCDFHYDHSRMNADGTCDECRDDWHEWELLNPHFMDSNGSVVCTLHAGNYLATALAKNPASKRVQTPITLWRRMVTSHYEGLAEVLNGRPFCELCEGR